MGWIAVAGLGMLLWILAVFVALVLLATRRWRDLRRAGIVISVLSIATIGLSFLAAPDSHEAAAPPTVLDSTPRPSPSSIVTSGPESDEDHDYMTEACNLMFNGAEFGFDFGDAGDANADLRFVTCKGSGGSLVYFRKEHLAETKTHYVKDGRPPGTPGGYAVPPLGTADATPIPNAES